MRSRRFGSRRRCTVRPPCTVDEPGLGALRLAHVLRSARRARRRAPAFFCFEKCDGELAGVEHRLGRRIAAALGAQDHVAARRAVEVEEQVVAAREPGREQVVGLVAAPDPDLETALGAVAPRREPHRQHQLADPELARLALRAARAGAGACRPSSRASSGRAASAASAAASSPAASSSRSSARDRLARRAHGVALRAALRQRAHALAVALEEPLEVLAGREQRIERDAQLLAASRSRARAPRGRRAAARRART